VSAPVVTLGGPPGSGKSTAGRRVASSLGLEFLSAGELFRAEAKRRGISLAELGRRAELDPSIDRALDDEMATRARPSRLLDGRITGPICRRRGIPVLYVVVTAEEEVRWKRIVGRDGGRLEEVARETKAREESERTRYLHHYKIDLTTERADLTVDASHLTPEQVEREVLRFLAAQGVRRG
jgi:predicted cytidylate kinase